MVLTGTRVYRQTPALLAHYPVVPDQKHTAVAIYAAVVHGERRSQYTMFSAFATKVSPNSWKISTKDWYRR